MSCNDGMSLPVWPLPHLPDMTPCMSPLLHKGPQQKKPGLGLIKDEAEALGMPWILGKNKTTTVVFLCLSDRKDWLDNTLKKSWDRGKTRLKRLQVTLFWKVPQLAI